jgi:hypothetical protein
MAYHLARASPSLQTTHRRVTVTGMPRGVDPQASPPRADAHGFLMVARQV